MPARIDLAGEHAVRLRLVEGYETWATCDFLREDTEGHHYVGYLLDGRRVEVVLGPEPEPLEPASAAFTEACGHYTSDGCSCADEEVAA
jgi:hypothetical protein